jgi:phosphohistidine phosphatase SixA
MAFAMNLYLLRSSLVDGAKHHLSLEGRQIVRAIGNKIRLTDEPHFDRFVTSPAPAAVQTAELFADRTDYVGVIEVLPLLAEATPASVIAPVLLAQGTSVVVIADEPLLASIGAFMVGAPTFPPSVHSQVSFIENRRPAWFLRPGEMQRQLLVHA